MKTVTFHRLPCSKTGASTKEHAIKNTADVCFTEINEQSHWHAAIYPALNSDYSMFACIQTRLDRLIQQVQLLPAVRQGQTGSLVDSARTQLGRRRRRCWQRRSPSPPLIYVRVQSSRSHVAGAFLSLGIPPSRLGMNNRHVNTNHKRL